MFYPILFSILALVAGAWIKIKIDNNALEVAIKEYKNQKS